MDETISTLEYAKRACNIMNCPEANKKSSRERAVTMLAREAERLRKDITALRTGAGFFVHSDNYNTLLTDTEKNDKIILNQNETIAKLEQQIAEVQQQIELEQKRWDDLMDAFKFTKLKTKEYKLKKLKTEAEKKVLKSLTVLYEERGKVITEKNQNLVKAADYSTNIIDETQNKIDSLYQKSIDDFKVNEQIMNSLGKTVISMVHDVQESKESHQQCLSKFNTMGNEVLQLSNNVSNKNKNYLAELDSLSIKERKSKVKDTVNKQIALCIEEKDYVVDQLRMLNTSIEECTKTEFQEPLSTNIPKFLETLAEESNSRKEDHSKTSLGMNDVRVMQTNHLHQRINDLYSYRTKTNETLDYLKQKSTNSIQDSTNKLQVLHSLKRTIEQLVSEEENESEEITKLADSIDDLKGSFNKSIEEQIKLATESLDKLAKIPDQLTEIENYQKHVSLFILQPLNNNWLA